MQVDKPRFDGGVLFLQSNRESRLQAGFCSAQFEKTFSIMVAQHVDEMQDIRCVESSVLEIKEFFKVRFLVLRDEGKRRIVHQLHQLMAFVDDGGAIAPGKNGGKETRDLDILFSGEAMRYGNRIFFDESSLVIVLQSLVQVDFHRCQLLFVHPCTAD